MTKFFFWRGGVISKIVHASVDFVALQWGTYHIYSLKIAKVSIFVILMVDNPSQIMWKPAKVIYGDMPIPTWHVVEKWNTPTMIYDEVVLPFQRVGGGGGGVINKFDTDYRNSEFCALLAQTFSKCQACFRCLCFSRTSICAKLRWRSRHISFWWVWAREPWSSQSLGKVQLSIRGKGIHRQGPAICGIHILPESRQ